MPQSDLDPQHKLVLTGIKRVGNALLADSERTPWQAVVYLRDLDELVSLVCGLVEQAGLKTSGGQYDPRMTEFETAVTRFYLAQRDLLLDQVMTDGIDLSYDTQGEETNAATVTPLKAVRSDSGSSER